MAAGANCAAQILCDFSGIYTGGYRTTPDSFVNIKDLSDLPYSDLCGDALQTRLFQAEGESRFVHIHRAIAEYLGAMWLAHCFDNGISERRIFSLFRQGEGVPTSLRGLHAWIAHFSDTLAKQCICSDPYAVLRYGDAETLTLDQARDLLAALSTLSVKDPYFRSEDGDRHPASGLMRLELRDNICAIIEVSCGSAHLRLLLLEAIARTALAKELAGVLDAVMFDRDRFYAERYLSWAALRSVRERSHRERVIGRLVAAGDPDSARLACEILVDIGVSTVSTDTAIETVLAYLRITANRLGDFESLGVRHVPDGLFDELDPARLAELLDGLSKRVRPLIRDTGHSAQSYIADLMRDQTARYLESGTTVEPARLWSWIEWLDGHYGYKRETKRRLAEILHQNSTVRFSLIEHVLLTPCAKNTWLAGLRLSKTKLNLWPTAYDLMRVLKSLQTRLGNGPLDAEVWQDLLKLARTPDGIPSVVRDEAEKVAADRPELLSILADMSQVAQFDWKTEEAKLEARSAKKRRATLRSHRTHYRKRLNDIAAGDPCVLHLPASVYLGHVTRIAKHVYFDFEVRPAERVREYLGNKLSRQVLAGFVAMLSRPDLPTATEIAEAHSASKHLPAEAPLICGIAELLRHGRDITGIDRNILAAAYMALRQAPASQGLWETHIVEALETILFQNEPDWEEHFRAFLEPQLARCDQYVYELHRLTDDNRFANLAGRLAVEWLRCFPALSADTQERLVACALRNAPHEAVQALAAESWTRVQSDPEVRLLWFAANYAVNFVLSRAVLEETAANDRDFIWIIRKRFPSEGEGVFELFSIPQLVFVIEAFGAHWPKVERPLNTVTSGDRNPWDATSFINNVIHAIAGRPTPEATKALEDLIAYHAPTYSETARHALALQRRTRRDFEYIAPDIDELRSAMTNSLPDTIDQMRAYFADRMEDLQARIRGSSTDMWDAYWDGDRPKWEPSCRNRMIEHISMLLPPSIRFEPEMHMPRQKRADIAAIRNSVLLPVEIKCQWHQNVWNAASDQLDANYTRYWQAEGRGVYVVLWFGRVPHKQLPGHPDRLQRPQTPERLRQMLIDRLPEERRSFIDVFVIDVSRPDR